jgi:hypothetical protein
MSDVFFQTEAERLASQARDRAAEAQRLADAPLKPKKPQEQCDIGLFSDRAGQLDLVDMVRAAEAGAVSVPFWD